MESATRLSVLPDTGALALLRQDVVAALGESIEPEARELLLVAVTEAVTNAIEAHQRQEIEAPIEVTVDTTARLVTVQDRAGGATAPEVPTTAPGPEARRGRGLLIMQSICPDLRLAEVEHGLRVELPYP